MKFARIAVAAALSVAALSASAVANDWAAHDPVEFGLGFGVGGGTPLLDTFSFTLGTAATLQVTAVTNDFLPTLDLIGSAISLYAGTVGSGTWMGSLPFDSVQQQTSTGLLSAGAYYYEVTSTVGRNAFAGSYTVTSQATVVPEPETYMMMIAGLAAIGFVATRRRNR